MISEVAGQPLRTFESTAISSIPSDWKVLPLERIAQLERGKFSARPRNDPKYFGGGIPFIQTGDVRNSGRLITSYAQTLNDAGLKVSKLFPAGTLFITIAANIGDLGFATFATACPDSLVAIRPRNSTDSQWLYFALSSQKVSFESIATQNAQLNLNLEKLRPYLITVPSTVEQKRIAEALSDVDGLIRALERLLLKKQAIKQGMMQQLLTGRSRLPGFSSPWSVRSIGEFAEVRAGGTPSTAVPRYWGGDIRWMSSGEVHQKRVHEVRGRITVDGLRESSAQLFPVGTVLIALAGQGKTRGTVAVSRVQLSTNQSIAGIFPSDEHDSDFLYYNLDTRYDELRGESAGEGGRGGLNLTIIKNLNVYVPEISEQIAIARAIADVDDEIEVLGSKLVKTRSIKQGMMQELLTGRTRLPVTEIAL